MTDDLIEHRRKASRETLRRVFPVALEVRSVKKGATVVEGYASVTEAPYEIVDRHGPYVETIRSGAFSKTLREQPQVQLLLNHGGLSMAYTRAGSLALSEDAQGLHMRAEVNPARGDVRDMLIALEDGAVDEMSFAFRATRDEWSDDFSERAIREANLNRGDVSVVNFGANPATSVAAEVALRATDLGRLDRAAARALIERLDALYPADTPETLPEPEGFPVDLLRMQRDRLALR